MAFFKINEREFPILDGSASVDYERIGSSTRAFAGHLIQTTRARARMLSAKTPILSQAEALAFVSLIRGDGHYWDFEDGFGYSSRGLGISSGSYSFVGGSLRVNSGSTVVFDVGFPASGPWTVGALYEGENIIVDSEGNEYRTGASDPGMSNILDVTASGFLMWGRDEFGASQQNDFDYAFAVPYLFTTSMLVEYSLAFPDYVGGFESELPALSISGNVFLGETVVMKADETSINLEPVQYMSGGSIAIGYHVGFKLQEVI